METNTRGWFQPSVSTATPVYQAGMNGFVKPAPKLSNLSRSYASIEATEIDYLWQERIPRAEVVLMFGDSGTGKGRFVANFIARLTRGDCMLDGTPGPGEPLSVIAVTPEDDPSTSMAWRLRAENADLKRVHDMTELPGGEFRIPEDIPLLRQRILEIGQVGLVFIDPLSQVATKSLNANVTVRKFIWGPLRQLARDTGATIVCMLHTTKDGKLQGSQGLRDAARVVLKIIRDKANPAIRLLHTEKGNDVDDSIPDVAYTITGERPNVHVEFVDRELEAACEGLSDGERKVLTIVRTRALEGKHTDPQQVSEMLHIKYGDAKVRMHRMARKEIIRRLERGWYTTPDDMGVRNAV